MGNVFDGGGGGSAPAPEPKKVEKAEVVEAKTQAKKTMAGGARRRGSLGSMTSLLSGGYRGFGTEDKLG